MSIPHHSAFSAGFPEQVWDGLTDSRNRSSVYQITPPDGLDFAKVAAEIRATQQFLLDLAPVVPVAAITLEAAENISALRWVKLNSNEQAILADNTTSVLLGIAVEPIVAGSTGLINIQGVVESTDFSLIPSAPYFLRQNGNMSTAPPLTGHVIRLGVAITPNQFLVEIYHVVNLGE